MTTKISSFIWRAVFTIAYTLVVLPFTVNFFKNIATPSSSEALMSIIPIIDAHNFMLPIFLAALEFSSISLAVHFWLRSHGRNRVLILVLFMACQSYAVTSVYYDVRTKDYHAERNAHESSKVEIIDSLKSRIGGLKEQISTLSTELNGIRKERDSNSSAIRQLLLYINREKNLSSKEAMRSEVQNREKLRERREREITDLFEKKKSLEDDLKKKEGELELYIQAQNNGMKHRSELEYIVKEFFTYKSGFVGFISFLFPISILAVAFVLPKNTRADAGELPLFNLKEHLHNAASLPDDMHLNYVRLLVPSLDAYLSALKASKKILNENDALNLHTSLIRQIINEVKGLQGQIASSKLEENSKSYMLNELNNLLNQQLTAKEEMSHV